MDSKEWITVSVVEKSVKRRLAENARLVAFEIKKREKLSYTAFCLFCIFLGSAMRLLVDARLYVCGLNALRSIVPIRAFHDWK